jgi:hypothetical protein
MFYLQPDLFGNSQVLWCGELAKKEDLGTPEDIKGQTLISFNNTPTLF